VSFCCFLHRNLAGSCWLNPVKVAGKHCEVGWRLSQMPLVRLVVVACQLLPQDCEAKRWNAFKTSKKSKRVETRSD
jgi:hypothetical protein